MTIKNIRLFGDTVLTKKADEVRDFDKELQQLVKDLTETMLEAPGVGLAAPQIGVSLRVFTYCVEEDRPGHLINPILQLSENRQDGDEGCLSIPGLAFNTDRSYGVIAEVRICMAKMLSLKVQSYWLDAFNMKQIIWTEYFL